MQLRCNCNFAFTGNIKQCLTVAGSLNVVCKMTEKWCIGLGLALMGKAVDVG
jgi:hypothetical protein